MRMQVILDSSFARPGSAPIWGGKKGEFRDWTMLWYDGPISVTSLSDVKFCDAKLRGLIMISRVRIAQFQRP